MGTLLCNCHSPIPVSVSYNIMPDFSNASGYLHDVSDNLVVAGTVALLAGLKHKDGLILSTKHGAWFIEATRIISAYMVEFRSAGRCNSRSASNQCQ